MLLRFLHLQSGLRKPLVHPLLLLHHSQDKSCNFNPMLTSR